MKNTERPRGWRFVIASPLAVLWEARNWPTHRSRYAWRIHEVPSTIQNCAIETAPYRLRALSNGNSPAPLGN